MLMFSWFLFLFGWVYPRLPTSYEYTTHQYPLQAFNKVFYKVIHTFAINIKKPQHVVWL